MITLVLPWYGPTTTGGAETQARSLARSLHSIGVNVQVWSSTGRDSFHPDETSYYPPGKSTLDNLPIWRFRTNSTDEQGIPFFFRKYPALLPPLKKFAPHEMALLKALLSSDELYEAILAEQQTHFIFLPYPFPTTFWGALIAPERSFLLPCLHDEPYAYYATYHYLFSQVRGILFNSYPEAELAQRLYNPPKEKIKIPGEGIDLAPKGDGQAFRQKYQLDPELKLLFYVGRRDESKNLGLLLSYTREYWASRGKPMKLLLAGRGNLEIPLKMQDLVLDIGFLAEEDKHNAYKAIDLFVLPSLYESFSIVLMEAWLQQTPALVHQHCAVTKYHCATSGGGLTFKDFGTFAAALDLLFAAPEIGQTLGNRGREYVLATCNWEDVARKTAQAMGILP